MVRIIRILFFRTGALNLNRSHESDRVTPRFSRRFQHKSRSIAGQGGHVASRPLEHRCTEAGLEHEKDKSSELDTALLDAFGDLSKDQDLRLQRQHMHRTGGSDMRPGASVGVHERRRERRTKATYQKRGKGRAADSEYLQCAADTGAPAASWMAAMSRGGDAGLTSEQCGSGTKEAGGRYGGKGAGTSVG